MTESLCTLFKKIDDLFLDNDFVEAEAKKNGAHLDTEWIETEYFAFCCLLYKD